MQHPTPITLFDYISTLASARGQQPGPVSDDPLPGGCERCHATITSYNAYFARFGLPRCRNCIGDDGFATALDLDLFRQTGELPCSGCGQSIQPAEISPDGTSCTYHCHTCGTTAHYTTTTLA
jgi:hypothetical protein